MKRFWRGLVWLASVLFLTACSSHAPVRYSLVAADIKGYNWWRVSFKINWPEQSEPLWHQDVLLAHQVIAPALDQHRDAIRLWRFHRRAARDAGGHRLSFLFYAPVGTAGDVYRSIQSNPQLADLQNRQQLEQVDYSDLTQLTQSQVNATSDKNWSPELQESWSYFIMGASEMWLHLIDRFAMQHSDIESNEALYRQVSLDINRIWQLEGRHALLHHLNALYAYQPIFFDESNMLRF